MTRRLAALTLALAACANGATPPSAPGGAPTTPPPGTPSPSAETSHPVVSFSSARAKEMAARLADDGPREAAGAAYRRAAAEVAGALESAGLDVEIVAIPVPRGVVDGIGVRAGTTRNVVARPRGFDPSRPFVVVGAHLDTVPDSPGANDNASGVAVMVELARLVAAEPPPLPVVFVAFGGEERRGPGAAYAFGSRAFVRTMAAAERRNARALVLDMVGAGRAVHAMGGPSSVRAVVVRQAEALAIPHRTPSTRFFSDHLPFSDAGIPVTWLWGGEHQTLHTPLDRAAVLDARQLGRVGRVAWATLRALD